MQDLRKDARIYIAGHTGLVGSAITRRLRAGGFSNILAAEREDLDLRDQAAVNRWFVAKRPEYVFLVAGTVGGILANSTRPAEFIYDNMMIHATVVHAAYREGVTKLLYLGSSCIYPREAPQPMKEEYLLTGPLEPTNEPYAVAKIAGIKLCQAYRRQYGCDFISAMPTNLYGPNDNFDLTSSHVLPALIRRFHDAKVQGRNEVVIWGPAHPGASSCTWTTSPMPVCSSWSATTGTRTSTWGPVRICPSGSSRRWCARSSTRRPS
jgi:GDP-L-fucose synthase